MNISMTGQPAARKTQAGNPSQTNTSLLPLTLQSVNLSIDGTALLSDICLTIDNDKITVLMGHNGAGKSLLVRVLHGILTPQSGQVEWNGQPVSDINVRKRQSMVFQKPVLLRRSVAANIDYVLALRNLSSKTRRNELLQIAGLSAKAKQQARSLSGGEQQRLAIARALATNPEVLLLDEPTANLDPQATSQIESLIHQASKQSIKIILVTHDLAQAQRVADDVIFLDNGTVAEHSSATTFFTQPATTAGHSYISGYLQIATEKRPL